MVVTDRAGPITYTERVGPIMAVCTPTAGHRACHPPDNVSWLGRCRALRWRLPGGVAERLNAPVLKTGNG
jgi:hypothetical protein